MSIYKEFCRETFDEAGNLIRFRLNYAENFNFGYDVVDRIADKTPDKRALVWCNTQGEEHIFTFKDIKAYSNKMANVFLNCGIHPGDRILVILKGHYEYWFAAVALHKLGAVLIPATHLLTAEDISHRLKTAHARAVICSAQDNVPEKVAAAVDLLCTEKPEQRPHLWCVEGHAEGFGDLMKETEAESENFERISLQAHDPMIIYFTSGTTGNPKGVIHDHTYPLSHIVTAKYWQQVEEDGLHFSVVETGWGKASCGKIYGQWLCGCAVMVYDFDNFDPKSLISIINRYGVTSFCAPPTIYRYMIRRKIPDMPSLRHVTTAGEMLAVEVAQRFKDMTGLTIYEGYGQTETCLLLANLKGHPPVPGSIGRPSPFYNVELRNQDNTLTSPGQIGEIVIVPEEGEPNNGIFCGYIDNYEQYAHSWENGVFHTGDAAYMDEDRNYFFHGRFDDMIKTGGYRVGPGEIENVLMKHPAVVECSVIGIPDKLRGQAIKAIIVPESTHPDLSSLEHEIKDFCNRQLADYKWVRIVEFVSEMPKTISGKIKKSLQRQEACEM